MVTRLEMKQFGYHTDELSRRMNYYYVVGNARTSLRLVTSRHQSDEMTSSSDGIMFVTPNVMQKTMEVLRTLYMPSRGAVTSFSPIRCYLCFCLGLSCESITQNMFISMQ